MSSTPRPLPTFWPATNDLVKTGAKELGLLWGSDRVTVAYVDGAVKLVAVGLGQLQMDHYGRVEATLPPSATRAIRRRYADGEVSTG
jgi:hypothetical protein